MNRPDFSNYLAHFTTSGEPNVTDVEQNVGLQWKNMTAYEKLISILRGKTINATMMPWTHASAICFTECPWSSLLAHTQTYSPYGIGFHKAFIYSRHGGPVYYIRPDHFKQQIKKGVDKYVWPLLTPFSPSYRPKHMKGSYFPTVDFSQEREWRVPHDLPFEYDNIEFVILNDIQDFQNFPEDLKAQIGVDKFILMENYKNVERLWPVHKMD